MVLDPRSSTTIYDDLKTRLGDSIATLTNFAASSFNHDWLNAYSEQVHTSEVKGVAAQLAGFVDWAGNDNLTQDDLDKLGITGATPDEINQFMDPSHLDELGALVGITRDQGQKATGKVTFTVSTDSVSIPEGFEVGTEPAKDGSYYAFYVDADGDGTIDESSNATISPSSGSTTVTADVIAKNVGDESNVGVGTITFMPSPEPGIEEVINNKSTTGGIDVQSNASYRKEIKNAVFSTSGGGTALGIEGYIEENATSNVDVGLKEFPDVSPPYVDVIVDGGSDSEIRTLIDESRPVAIRHYLVRPSNLNLGSIVEVDGKDIDTKFVEDVIKDYLIGLNIGATYSRSKLTQRIMSADESIQTISGLSVSINSTVDEFHTYESGVTVYELEYGPLGKVTDEEHRYVDGQTDYTLVFEGADSASVSVEAIVDDERVTLAQGSTGDYTVVDADGDALNDTISLTGNTYPDVGTTLLVTYNHTAGSVDTVTDENGTTYTKGTDYGVVDSNADGLDDSIDWSIGGSSPSAGTRFFIDYSPKRSVTDDLSTTQYEKISSDVNNTRVTSHE